MYEKSVSPVVSTVLEEIGNRHGAVRELVNEEGLEESFSVVEHPGDHSKTSLLRHRLGGGSIDETRPHSQDEHDHQGSCVFEHKNLRLSVI